jgi:hypothetical protein
MNKERVFTAIYLAVVEIALMCLVSGLVLQDWYLLFASATIVIWLLFLQHIAIVKTIAKLQNSTKNGRFQNS